MMRMMTLEHSTDQRNMLVYQFSVEPSCFVVEIGVRSFLTLQAFIANHLTLSSPSHCAIRHFSSTIAIHSNAFRCSALYTSFRPADFTIVAP